MWHDLAVRTLNNFEILMWNHIIHSWFDPIGIAILITIPIMVILWFLVQLGKTK